MQTPENFDEHLELCALWHILFGECTMLKTLTPDHFYSTKCREIFNAMSRTFDRDGDVSPFTVEEELQKSSLRGYAWMIRVNHGMFLGASHQVIRKLNSYVARRNAASFKADPKGELPDQFIDKGHELQEILRDERESQEDIFERIAKGVPTIPTGFADIDALLGGGIEHGSIFVVAARPGVGKTALAVNLAVQAVEAGKTALFVTLEEPPEKIYTRFMQRFWNETREQVRRHAHDLRISEFKCIATAANVNRILSAIHENLQHDLIIVDYYQLITEDTGETHTQQLELISNSLKRFALEYRKPIVLCAQLNRSIETDQRNREPELSDLRGCGALEQDASVVSFLWDENAKDTRSKADTLKGKVRPKDKNLFWILRKNRNGALGKVALDFDPMKMSMKISSLSDL